MFNQKKNKWKKHLAHLRAIFSSLAIENQTNPFDHREKGNKNCHHHHHQWLLYSFKSCRRPSCFSLSIVLSYRLSFWFFSRQDSLANDLRLQNEQFQTSVGRVRLESHFRKRQVFVFFDFSLDYRIVSRRYSSIIQIRPVSCEQKINRLNRNEFELVQRDEFSTTELRLTE